MDGQESIKEIDSYEEVVRMYRLDKKSKRYVKRKRQYAPKPPNFKPVAERFKKEIAWPLRMMPLSERLLVEAPYKKREQAILNAYDSRRILDSIKSREYPAELNAVGAFSFLCSLIEGRIHAMYEARKSLIQGTAITAKLEEDEYYLFMESTGNVNRSYINLDWAMGLLYQYGDVDDALKDEIRVYQRMRNPLTHESFLRRAHFTHEILERMMLFYSILTRYRAVQNSMIKREQQLFFAEEHNMQTIQYFEINKSYTRSEIYQKLGGGIVDSLSAPFRFGKPVYVLMPRVEKNGLRVKAAAFAYADIFNGLERFDVTIPYFIDGGTVDQHDYRGLKSVTVCKINKDCIEIRKHNP